MDEKFTSDQNAREGQEGIAENRAAGFDSVQEPTRPENTAGSAPQFSEGASAPVAQNPAPEQPLEDASSVPPHSAPVVHAPAVTAGNSPRPVYAASAVSAPPEKKQRNGVWLTVAIILLAISLLMSGFAIWAAKNGTMEFNYQIPQSVTPNYNYRTDVSEGDELTTQEIIAKVSPSVVTISVSGYSQQSGQVSGFGTGIIYTDNGYILTNAHVVKNATTVTVMLKDGTEYSAKIIGADTDSDVAVIKIEATGLPPAEFGQSSSLVPGDRIVAIGTPYDISLSQTSTEGIVSALRNDMYFPDLGYTLDLIQHSAAINSGNSGGPLINRFGQVIGINSIKISGTYENLGFALQIDQALPLAEELMNTGKVSRPGIGITGQTYNSGDIQGAYIYSVTEGGPAATAGLQRGDIIIEADGEAITSIDDLKEVIRRHKIGESLEVQYLRGGEVKTATIQLYELQNQ